MQKTILAAATLVLLCACGKDNERKTATQEAVAVKVMQVGVPALQGGARTYSATIEPMNAVALSFATGGTVRQVLVEEGQTVRAGQIIATVDPATVTNSAEAAAAATAQAEDVVRQAEDVYAQAKDAYDRLKLLHDRGSLAEIKWIEAETRLKQAETAVQTARSGVRAAQATERIARKGVADTRLTAPTGGYISQRLAEAGQNVLLGAPVAMLVQIDRVKVKLAVPEEEIAAFAKGQRVRVSVAALGGKTFEGVVAERGVVADALSRSYEVKAVVENPRRELLPGMIAEAVPNVATASQHTERAAQAGTTAALSLPAELVQIDADNRPFVWTVADGKARRCFVELGANAGRDVIILSGLSAGAEVICEGQQKVSEGTRVNIIK